MLFKFSGPYAIFRVGHLPALYTVAYLGILAVLGRRPRVTGGRGGRGINYRIVYTARRGAERQKSKRNVRGDVTHAAARAAGSSPEDRRSPAPRTTSAYAPFRCVFLTSSRIGGASAFTQQCDAKSPHWMARRV